MSYRKQIFLVLFLIIFTASAYSQQSQWMEVASYRSHRNVLKFNVVVDIISLGFGYHDYGLLSYERGYGIFSTSVRPVLITLNSTSTIGYGLGAGIIEKVFPINFERDIPKGLYIGIPLSGFFLNAGKTRDALETGYGISTGGLLGFQWIFHGGFTIDVFVGPAFMYSSFPIIINQISSAETQFNLRMDGGLNIGFAF